MVKTQKSHPREWVDYSDPVLPAAVTEVLNPINGSWWIVQIQPCASTLEGRTTEQSLECARLFSGWDLNNPPTSVTGILGFRRNLFYRLNLNNPSTPLGGISRLDSNSIISERFSEKMKNCFRRLGRRPRRHGPPRQMNARSSGLIEGRSL